MSDESRDAAEEPRDVPAADEPAVAAPRRTRRVSQPEARLLRRQNAKLQKANEQMAQELAELRATRDALRHDLERSQAAQQKAERAQASLQTQIAERRSQAKALRAETGEKLAAARAETAGQIKQLKHDLRILQHDHTDLARRNQILQQQMDTQSAKRRETQAEHKAMAATIKEQAAEIARLKQAAERMLQRAIELQVQLDQAQENSQTLSSKLVTLQSLPHLQTEQIDRFNRILAERELLIEILRRALALLEDKRPENA